MNTDGHKLSERLRALRVTPTELDKVRLRGVPVIGPGIRFSAAAMAAQWQNPCIPPSIIHRCSTMDDGTNGYFT